MPVIRWPMRTDARQFRAVQLVQPRLVVEKIELRRRTRLVQIDHPLGFRRKVRQTFEPAGIRLQAGKRAPGCRCRRRRV